MAEVCLGPLVDLDEVVCSSGMHEGEVDMTVTWLRDGRSVVVIVSRAPAAQADRAMEGAGAGAVPRR